MSNKLIDEESPYLLQHANNPVDWYPWSEEAFERAKSENRPIFLSIGYSSCHWCHVMERESFENDEIAKILNENFISIKVDKEERPDIDKHFQEVYQKMNSKAGGWPLSIFMTPQKTPFYSATYIPLIPNYGRMGMKELLKIISDSWKKDSKTLEEKGQEVLNAMEPKSRIEATKIDERLIDTAIFQIKQVYDKINGGFGTAPKFPQASTLELAINLYKLTNDSDLKDIITHTLDSMMMGGMYDIVEGGFYRYSTDDIFLIPHFEKMTYDNAQLLKVYIKAYSALKIQRYKDIAIEIANFMIEKMSSNNLFFSASDADTNGIEGEYFIYDYNEVKEKFEKEGLGDSIIYNLSITKNGNFDGKSIARYRDLSLMNKSEAIKAISILKNIREGREYPFIDKKVITSWNSMMITALFELASIENKYEEIAIKYLKALTGKMREGVKLYHSSMPKNKPKIEGFLEDYAYYIEALLAAFNATLDESYLIEATAITNEAVRLFYKEGRWKIGNLEYKNFVNDFDSSYPSSLSIMVENLLTIRSLSEIVYEKFAFSTLQVQSYNLMRQPISRPKLANEAIRYLKDDKIIKSNIENLNKIKKIEFNYPFTLLKPTNDEDIQICNTKSCFASVGNILEVKNLVDS